jgi:hypothetical protein
MIFGIISDCRGPITAGRQSIRFQTLFGHTPVFVGVSHELEAAGALLDALDAALCVDQNAKGVILVNVAPRNGEARQFENGAPFCLFRVNDIFVISTIGMVLSLVKKFGLVSSVRLLDIPTVMKWAVQAYLVDQHQADEIIATQFRSYEFALRIAYWIGVLGKYPPSKEVPFSDVAPNPPTHHIWSFDEFGNGKTTILDHEIERLLIENVGRIITRRIFTRLKDVPDDGKLALTRKGSSGFGKRFMEIVVQGGSAAKISGLKIGDSIFK